MYILGSNRLFYQASGFQTGLTVTGKLIDADLATITDPVIFTEFDTGEYYCDVVIPAYGTYLMRVSENGVSKLIYAIQVDRPWMQRGIITYIGKDLEFPS